eukprot:Amastigsp_a948_114.p2 type:complete len:147 gc:universal Amastigsp_a948_114:383-823(+)
MKRRRGIGQEHKVLLLIFVAQPLGVLFHEPLKDPRRRLRDLLVEVHDARQIFDLVVHLCEHYVICTLRLFHPFVHALRLLVERAVLPDHSLELVLIAQERVRLPRALVVLFAAVVVVHSPPLGAEVNHNLAEDRSAVADHHPLRKV